MGTLRERHGIACSECELNGLDGERASITLMPSVDGQSIERFYRDGAISYGLHPPGARTYRVSTRGDFDDRIYHDVGQEDGVQSRAYYFESVFAAGLGGQMSHPDGAVRVFAHANPVLSVELHGAKVTGGKSENVPSTAWAKVQVACSHEVTFGAKGGPLEYYLFVRGPVPLLPDDTTITRRIAGKIALVITNVSDNTSLGVYPLDVGSKLDYYSIEHDLRAAFPAIAFEGKVIRFQVEHLAEGRSEDPGQTVAIGGVVGLAVLQVRRK